ncbi:FAD-dependent oxidoreductase [Paraburkholderia sp. ZP32-5]|uniref:FAD-dependent oxidoreductase n=1 Tax=Paraburkholderia sp. ZP32-5 TaxID=2883245 RepID=UPI001F2E546F|nr:FAD-dependent oxidoreductase [Paraburkholderia sp. ZP32-5]
MRESLSRLEGGEYDVAIIGGGINGASAAQHLASAGYSVVLVEKNDYASAASSRSSRILHSGLRYFAPSKTLWEHVFQPRRFVGRVRSAIESMTAMGQLVSTMPERFIPLSLMMPVYRNMPYSGWHVDIGVKVLGFFNRFGVPLVYKRYRNGRSTPPAMAKWFRDNGDITDFTVFMDYSIRWPERICVDAVMDARRLGAVVRNYTTMEQLSRTADGRWSLALRDTLEPAQTATVTARLVLNTAGVWIDALNKAAAQGTAPARRVIAVKGIHILVRLPDDFKGEGLASLNRENEAIFCVPWGDLHYIGPTEVVYHENIDDVTPDEEGIEFLIDEANHLLPGINLSRSDVCFAWAGVRPITYDPRYPKGRRLPFSVLHDLASDGLPNVLTLTWGTINLHRVSANHILKAVKRKLKPSRGQAALNAGASRFKGGDANSAVFPDEPSISLDDLVDAARNEDATNLVDLLFRRTHLGWRHAMTRSAIRRAARAVAPEFGWSARQIDEQVDAFVTHMKVRHLVDVTDDETNLPASTARISGEPA